MQTKPPSLPFGCRTPSRLTFIFITTVLALCLCGASDSIAQDTTASTAIQVAAAPSVNTDSETFNEKLEQQPWMQTIDLFFKAWLVDPMATALFFDISFGLFDHVDPATNETVAVNVPFVVIWLLIASCYLTVRMKLINVRGFLHALSLIRGKYDDPSEPGEVTHFQALSSALSATVGLGNIGGVALAIGMGGPGATFWMIVIGLLGMTSKFAECTLGQMFRQVDSNGRVLGGPMRYLKVGLERMGIPVLGTVLSVVFAVLCVGASFGGGNAFQVGQSLGVLQQAEEFAFLRTMPYLYGIAMAIAVGLVIIGGIKSIGAVAGKIVPFMCAAYVLTALYIIGSHWEAIPIACYRIINEAFNPQAAIVGGAISVLIFGVQRAVFSNEAGVGSAAIAHSAAKTDEPVSEGIVALIEPFIDTVIVCTFTALCIIVTGVFETPEGIAFSMQSNGAALTRMAFVQGGQEWFAYILYGSVILFAFSTCISWSYYGERSFVSLFGEASSPIYKFFFLSFTILGSIISRGNILDFSDLMILAMSVPNLIGVYIMSGLIARSLNEYWRKYKAGELDPDVKYTP